MSKKVYTKGYASNILGNAGVEITGLAETALQLRQFGNKAVDHAARQMRSLAEKVEKKAKDYVPEDSEELMKSIRTVTDRGGIRGRLRLEVVVGGRTVELHRSAHADRLDVDLDQYAWIIHEDYESMKPGKKTIAKMERVGRDKVGSGFLRRAADEERKNLRKQLFDGFKSP